MITDFSNLNATSIPAIWGVSQGMPVTEIQDLSTLKNEGGIFDGASAMLGDKWEFPTMDKMVVRKQPTRAGGNNNRFLILAERTRNGKTELAWFNLNSLLRQDASRNYLMSNWVDLGNHHARMEKLAGRVIEITDTIEYSAQKFENGRPVEGQTVPGQKCPIVPFN